ncbi:MAG: Uncharacterised protein [Rhodospirillaceae bacterium]|nr:MAG: Uncharacterised protein [Rhodospirillaceae bacterium]
MQAGVHGHMRKAAVPVEHGLDAVAHTQSVDGPFGGEQNQHVVLALDAGADGGFGAA